MFAQLLASAPTHDEGARPTIISGLIHCILIAAAVQATRTIASAPAREVTTSNEVYLAPRVELPQASTSTAAATTRASASVPIDIPAPAAVNFDGALPEVSLPPSGTRYDPTATRRPELPMVAGTSMRVETPWQQSDVDEPVSDQRGPEPVYPAVLAQSGIPGEVLLRYVVGVDGRVEVGSIVVLQSTRPEFGVAAADAIRQARFTPARRRGVAVRQLVEQRVRFSAVRNNER